MGKILKGELATQLSFDTRTFEPTKVKARVIEAGTVVRSGPNAGQKRTDNVAIVRGKVEGKGWGTAIQVGQLATAQNEKMGTFFVAKSFKVTGDTYQGELLDEFSLGSNDGRWYGSN